MRLSVATCVILLSLINPVGLASAEESVPSFSSQIRFPVEKYTLPNGLVVILQEDHSVPLISYHTWFRVGSKDEQVGTTGIAHLFEHMMFKGAQRYSGDQFDNILQLNGATNNAFTTHDYTGYYENLPSSKLELVMDIESDRMSGLQVTAENLKSEREVVKEERRFRVDNNPQGVLREAIFQTAYRVHPYRWPTIGYMDDINNITLEKAQAFYHTYYAPNNAILVIAGDFKPADAKRLIEKYYGSLKAQEIPRTNRPPEPGQTSQRVLFLRKELQSTTFGVAFHVPQAGSDDSYALDLLANIMGHGSSSRLYRRLVYKDQTASAIGVSNYTSQDPGLFEIFVSLKPGADTDKAQRAVYGEMWRPRNLLVTDDELATAKKAVMKGFVDSLKSTFGKAEALAFNEVLFGNYEKLFTDLDKYDKISKEDIRKVAQKYLIPEKSNLVILKPVALHAQKKGI
jgi:zinc protease